IQSGGSTINFAGPVTYLDGSINFGNWANNKTLSITGMLVRNGSVSMNASSFRVNVTDRGNGKSGIFLIGSMNWSHGRWDLDGVLYLAGSLSVTNPGRIDIDGAMVVAGSTSMNLGQPMNINYNPTRIAATLSGGSG